MYTAIALCEGRLDRLLLRRTSCLKLHGKLMEKGIIFACGSLIRTILRFILSWNLCLTLGLVRTLRYASHALAARSVPSLSVSTLALALKTILVIIFRKTLVLVMHLMRKLPLVRLLIISTSGIVA